MSRSAAFFDLDRTLLAGASGCRLLRRRCATAGLVSREIPGEIAALRAVQHRSVRPCPSMALARQAVTMLAKGQAARSDRPGRLLAAAAAHGSRAMVQPLRRAPVRPAHAPPSRPIVLATTTPYDLVKPLADLLGLDGVVATRYGVNADGTYDGTIWPGRSCGAPASSPR